MDSYEQIIEGVRREQRASQLAFYDSFHGPTYHSAAAVLGAGDEAEEVMQDVLMKVLLRPSLLQSDAAAMTRYLRRMATNAAIDRLRRDHAPLTIAINEDMLHEPPSDEPDDPDELRFADIAAALRANPSSVRVQYTRGLSRLRKLLTRKEEG